MNLKASRLMTGAWVKKESNCVIIFNDCGKCFTRLRFGNIDLGLKMSNNSFLRNQLFIK